MRRLEDRIEEWWWQTAPEKNAIVIPDAGWKKFLWVANVILVPLATLVLVGALCASPL